jgi:amino acid transporter
MSNLYDADPEKGNVKGESPERNSAPEFETGMNGETEAPWTTRFVDSFRRDPNAAITKPAQRGGRGREYDHKAAAEATANSGLAHKLKGRHMQMIAIGGSIGE